MLRVALAQKGRQRFRRRGVALQPIGQPPAVRQRLIPGHPRYRPPTWPLLRGRVEVVLRDEGAARPAGHPKPSAHVLAEHPPLLHSDRIAANEEPRQRYAKRAAVLRIGLVEIGLRVDRERLAHAATLQRLLTIQGRPKGREAAIDRHLPGVAERTRTTTRILCRTGATRPSVRTQGASMAWTPGIFRNPNAPAGQPGVPTVPHVPPPNLPGNWVPTTSGRGGPSNPLWSPRNPMGR